MRLPSGTNDQYVYFYGVDATDFTTPETGLATWTVYRSRDGAAATIYTTPTINETSAANMPGVYELLVDEDTTIAAGNDSEEMVLFITHAGMAPVVRTIELYRPKITLGETLTTSSGLISNTTAIASVSGAVGSVTGAVGSVTGNVGGNVAGSVGSVTGAVGSVTGAVGSVTAAVTLPTIPANWITAAGIATDAIGSDELAASALTAIKDAIWDAAMLDHLDAETTGLHLWAAGTSVNVSAEVWNAAQSGHVAVGSFGETATEIAAILADTGTDGVVVAAGSKAGYSLTATTGLGNQTANITGTITTTTNLTNAATNGDLTATMKASVNTEVDTALADIHLDHLLAVDYDPASKPGTSTALLNELVESDAGISRFSANALEQAPTGGSAPTAAQIADAVWLEAIADHSATVGSTAESLAAAGGSGDPWVTSLPGSYTGTQAGKILADILVDTAEIGTAGAGLTALASAANLATVDNVVDAILVDTDTTLPAQITALNDLTGAEVADAVWDEVLNTHVTVASAAVYLKNTHAHAETVDTDWANGGRLDLILDARASQTSVDDLPTNAELATSQAAADDATLAAIAALNNLSAGQVTAAVPTALQNADALLNRDMSAISDTTARSPLNALRLLRNKYSIAGGVLTVTKENDTTQAWTAVITSDAAADPIIGSDPT